MTLHPFHPPSQVSYDDKNWVDKTIFDMCRENFNADLIRQVEEPVYFVDFLREPVVDDETGGCLVLLSPVCCSAW